MSPEQAARVLRAVAGRVQSKAAEKATGYAAMLERAPAGRAAAIVAALSMVEYPELRAASDHEFNLLQLINRALPEALQGIDQYAAQLVLGQNLQDLTGLTAAEARQWVRETHGRTDPIEWLLQRHNIDADRTVRHIAVARWLIAVMRDRSRRAAIERARTFQGPTAEVVTGRFIDRVDELAPTDLQRSVERTFERAAHRVARANARALQRATRPLARVPTWWHSSRFARLLLTGAELAEEGRAMKHCVATYAHAVARRRCLIVALRVRRQRSTVEVDPRTARVLQHRGALNQAPPALCVAALRMLSRQWCSTIERQALGANCAPNPEPH